MAGSVAPESAPEVELDQWCSRIDALLAQQQTVDALFLIQGLLRRLPRYLPAYVQMLQAHWLARRWEEGALWARRLLRADPTQELGWAMLAQWTEAKGQPTGAHRYWRLAFEQAPYHRTIRSGLVRTTVGRGQPLMLNRAALATIYRTSGQWQKSLELYSLLAREHPQRVDYQCGLLEAYWQLRQAEPALALARRLVSQEVHLILGWLVSADLGDENDQALAQAPLASLDRDGAYTLSRYAATNVFATPERLQVSPQEMALFNPKPDASD